MRLRSPALPSLRRSARLGGHPIVLDADDAPTVAGHAVEMEDVEEEEAAVFDAARVAEAAPPVIPTAREVAASEAARARLYGGEGGQPAGGSEVR